MYKSELQRRYMHYAENKGLISPKVVDEFDKASKGKKLPEKARKSVSFNSNLKKFLKDNPKGDL